MKKGGGGFNPYFNRGGGGFQKKSAKPLFTMQNSKPMDSDDTDENLAGYANGAGATHLTDREHGEYAGWKLYFPRQSFKESVKLVRRIKAMEAHFDSFSSWYQSDIEETCLLPVNLRNLEEDMVLRDAWPELFQGELVQEPTQTLACIGLAMHNIIVNSSSKKGQEFGQHRKIYIMPLGHEPIINICNAHGTNGCLISVTGQIVRMDAQEAKVKMMCFRCSLCSTELVVKQNPDGQQLTYPSVCVKGCNARSGFVEQFSSPHSIFQAKQMIKLRESTYIENQELGDLLVELNQGQLEAVQIGKTVTVTGIIKHSKEKKFAKSTDSKSMKTYLKCYTAEAFEKTNSHMTSSPSEINTEFLRKMQNEPSPFLLLVNSLCPMVFGREEIKAGLILSILSGKGLLNIRRSESHVLLIGNPGTGKSKLLQACAEVSAKGIFVSGPTSTGAGLTASVGKKGGVDAGALILSNGGACCVDEFDKMASSSHVLLEVAEQQTVSIQKYGANANFEARVNIIAAANPSGSYLDNSKTLSENTKIAAPMMSRFDLIFKVENHERYGDSKFLSHISFTGKQDQAPSESGSFFGTPAKPKLESRKKNLRWLHVADDEAFEPISQELMKFYCEYVRETFKPKLTEEAKAELLNFFTELRSLNLGHQVQMVTHRQLEAFLRLTLSRARADMCKDATAEHALDVINLVKFSMSDVFAREDEPNISQIELSFKTPGAGGSRANTASVAKLSIPKQTKLYLDHLESQDNTEFTRAEMKAMAQEVGIKDFEEIVFRLNREGVILKTADGGYKMG